ncbi:hypothetical protein [Arcobacter arenosus]|uniref:hypothetical protein n=1 Tax=Arcobacter arenosus TaxID=2576037 RepID=UPI003BAC5C8D
MVSDYSIDLQSENIFKSETKEYFKEVLSSYISGNYRSAIVVLWTVTIVDLILKLQDLVSIYGDTTAQKILEEIKQQQSSNKKSPQWEADLIKLIDDRTDMFEVHEIVNIESLQQHRHLSAHPIIKDSLELFQPNKETARAHIRNILESVLTKPPLASNKILNTLLEDLSKKKDLFPEIGDLQQYMKSAYLKNMPIPVIKFIFKKLWKFCFKSIDKNCEDNRTINLRGLAVLIREYNSTVTSLIKNDKDYYGSNISLENDIRLEYFHLLARNYPDIYFNLDNIYQKALIEKFKQDKKLYICAYFIFSNNEKLLNAINENLNVELMNKKSLIKDIVKDAINNECYNELIDIFVEKFNSSPNFSASDIMFKNIIEPYLKDMTEENIISIIKGINENYQLYNRNKASSDNKKIYDVALEILDEEFNFIEYSNFIDNCDLD